MGTGVFNVISRWLHLSHVWSHHFNSWNSKSNNLDHDRLVRFMKVLSCWDKCWDLISVYLLLIHVCNENHFSFFWKSHFIKSKDFKLQLWVCLVVFQRKQLSVLSLMLKSKLHLTKVIFYHKHIHSLISISTIYNQIWRLYPSIMVIFEGNESVCWVWCWDMNSFPLITIDFVTYPTILIKGIPIQTTKTTTGW